MKTLLHMNVGFFALALVSASAFAAKPNDAQIADIVVTANRIDVDAAKTAEAKTENPEVKKFARQMITDHQASNDQATSLAKKLKLTPKPSETTRTLEKQAKTEQAKVETLHGPDFDMAYVNNEVAYHQQVLDEIDKNLLPNAKNPQLKALLEKTRPVIQEHLDHAKMVQSKLSSVG